MSLLWASQGTYAHPAVGTTKEQPRRRGCAACVCHPHSGVGWSPFIPLIIPPFFHCHWKKGVRVTPPSACLSGRLAAGVPHEAAHGLATDLTKSKNKKQQQLKTCTRVYCYAGGRASIHTAIDKKGGGVGVHSTPSSRTGRLQR